MNNHNLQTLNETLFSTLEDLRSGKIKREDAKVINELAGTLINNAKTQLEAIKITKGLGQQAEIFGVKTLAPTPEILQKDLYDQKVEFSISKGFTNVSDCIAKLGGRFELEFKAWKNSLSAEKE